MLKQAKKVMPLTLMMACGKDNFSELYKKLFQVNNSALIMNK
jgi:hypothetical protein